MLFLTSISIVHAIATSVFYDPNPLRFIHHLFVYLLLPFILAISFIKYPEKIFIESVVLIALSLALLNILIMPIELAFRGGIDYYHQLNFSGRAYEIVSIILLGLTMSMLFYNKPHKLLSLALLLTSFLSFSRGALIVTLFVLGSIWWRQFLLVLKLKTITVIFVIIFIGYLFYSGSKLDPIEFWALRLNFDETNTILTNLEGFFSFYGRKEIWSIGYNHIIEWPIWGTGMASTKYYISEFTNGVFAFSGYHNLSITILAERGIFVGSIFLLLFLFVLYKLVIFKRWNSVVCYIGFLIFSHTTGTELILNSSSARNANILLFLFILVSFILNKRKYSVVQ